MFKIFTKKNEDITHNAKKVKKWHSEHRKLEEYAGKVLSAYDKQDIKQTRKYLNKLELLALNHLMNEDVTFFELLKKSKGHDTKVVSAINEFRHSFMDIKKALFHFFIYYTNPKNDLDTLFKKKLDGIISALVARIEFEEQNLYVLIGK